MSKTVYFSNLDSLRTLAFLFVFFEHICWSAIEELNLSEGLLKHVLYTLFCNGGMGVSIFFVLSGFLITYLLLEEKRETGNINVGAFYMRRILRIWPLYLLLIVVVFYGLALFYKLTHNPITNNANIVYYFLFISNFDVLHIHEAGQTAFMQSSVTWSVSIEEQFYLLWPLLFFIVSRKYYPFIFIFFIFLGVVFRMIYWKEGVFIYFHTLGNCADLAIGGMCAWLVLNKNRFLDFFRQLSAPAVYFTYVLGTLYIILNGYFLLFPMCNVVSRVLCTCFYAFILLTQNYNQNIHFKLGKYRFLNWSGKYTYGLYLLHPMGFFVVKCVTDFANIEGSGFYFKLVVALATLVATYVLSWLSYHFYEKKFLQLKNRFTIIKSGQ